MRKLIVLTMVMAMLLALAGCSSKSEPKLTPEQIKEKSKQGLDFVHNGKFEEANQVLEQAAKSGELDAKSYVMLGISRFQKNDYEGALQAYDKAIALDPKMAEPFQGKANIYRNQNNLKEAETWYRKAWQANSLYLDAYTELALQLSLANRVPDAITVIQEGIRNNPGALELQVVLANYYRQNKQIDLAKQTFEAVLKVDGTHQGAKAGLEALGR